MWRIVVGKAVSDVSNTSRPTNSSSRVKQANKNPLFAQYMVAFLININIYLFMVYLTTLSIAQTIQRQIVEWSVYLKICEIKHRDPSWGNVAAFTWRGSGKPHKTSVMIVGVPVKIRTAHPRNTKWYLYCLVRLFVYINIYSYVYSYKLQGEITLKFRN